MNWFHALGRFLLRTNSMCVIYICVKRESIWEDYVHDLNLDPPKCYTQHHYFLSNLLIVLLLSLVEKLEPVQVCFTLRLRDQRSMWMQDGYKVYMDSYMASIGSCFMVTWIIFQTPPLGGRPHTKPGDHGTPNVHNC